MSNDSALQRVLEAQATRLKVLRAAFDRTENGRKNHYASYTQIAEQTGIDVEDVIDAARFLSDQSLVEIFGTSAMGLTSYGRAEVERTITAPSQGTDNFLPAAIQIVNNTTNNHHNTTTTVHGHVGANVVGSNNTTTTTQTVNTFVHNEVHEKVAELRKLAAELPAPQRQEAEEILVEWDDAVQSNDKGIVKRLPREGRRLSDLFTFANVAAGVQAVPALVDIITRILSAALSS